VHKGLPFDNVPHFSLCQHSCVSKAQLKERILLLGNLGATAKAILTNLGIMAAIAYAVGFVIAAVQLIYWYTPDDIFAGANLASQLPRAVAIERALTAFFGL
jgi:hypothetical protein